MVLKISSFILIPLYAQLAIAGFAGDDKRMIAYTFIIYIPAALFYVQKLFERVPYELGVLMTIPLLVLGYFDYRFTLPICFLILLTGTRDRSWFKAAYRPATFTSASCKILDSLSSRF